MYKNPANSTNFTKAFVEFVEFVALLLCQDTTALRIAETCLGDFSFVTLRSDANIRQYQGLTTVNS